MATETHPTTNGTSLTANPIEEQPTTKEATAKVLEVLQGYLDEYMDSVVNGCELKLTTTGNDQQGQHAWPFQFSAKKMDSDQHWIGVKAIEGDDAEDPQALVLTLEVDNNKIIVKLRRDGSGKGKKFELLELGETLEGKNWIADPQERSFDYGTVSENILETWFPNQADQTNSSLQIPLKLSSRLNGVEVKDDLPEHWGSFLEGGVQLSIPKVSVSYTDDALSLDDVKIGVREEWGAIFFSLTVYWLVRNCYDAKGTLRDNKEAPPPGYPLAEKFRATRPIDLHPADVIDRLEEEGLRFPWHVVESACAALNAGKHVIFTGPPGCGKSKLSTFLAKEATGRDPLMATASPAWTAGELIGRYLPSTQDHGLVFREGFFLRANDTTRGRSRWLIIDEFNRADIDACFGELFSVLAGDMVELPYEKQVTVEADEDEADKSLQLVRILPPDRHEEAESDADYRVSERFRLIGTMNDADRSGLNNLSFALMRRFATIPVEPPPGEIIEDLIEKAIDRETEDLQLSQTAWDVSLKKATRCSLESIHGALAKMFAAKGSQKLSATSNDVDEPSQKKPFTNLVNERIVGVSVLGDIVRFVAEGLRAGKNDAKLSLAKNIDGCKAVRSTDARAQTLTLSYLAMGVVLQVFPQLEALSFGGDRSGNKLSGAISLIFEAIHDGASDYAKPKDLTMLRVTRSDDGYVLDGDQTIGAFLYQNLLTRFPEQDEAWFRDHLEKWIA